MAIPEEIRKVPRPANTVVVETGREGPNHYAVRERNGVKYVAGGNPQPQNGKVIGHIWNGEFVPKEEKVVVDKPDCLSYGASALVKSVSKDILEDLMGAYAIKDAFTIMAIATLRIIKSSITNGRLASEYNRTFVCKDYPRIGISPNTVSSFIDHLGRNGKRRREFYQKRIMRVATEHHIAIDSMLKQNTSEVNDLSAFSYKARIKGCKDISVVYAYDVETMEPVCAEVFPGNFIDANAYRSFIVHNDIRQGIITDKGFPPVRIINDLGDRPDLHFLTPIKRNDSRIFNNEMLSFTDVLEGVDDHVLYKKKAIKGGRYLYSFKSARKASLEENTFLEIREKKHDFDINEYEKKRSISGVIVFESDLDIPPKTVYLSYADRWKLELVFRQYKNDLDLDHTNVQSDFSVIGSEFINFIATTMTCRIVQKAIAANLLNKMSFGDFMEDLRSAWRIVDAPTPPRSDDDYWVHTPIYVFKELEALGLSIPTPVLPPKKPGRPRKNP